MKALSDKTDSVAIGCDSICRVRLASCASASLICNSIALIALKVRKCVLGSVMYSGAFLPLLNDFVVS